MSAMLFAACGDQMSNNKNTNEMTELNLTQEWDKTFPKSENVNHTKVTFRNRYGIELAADMYTPKNASGKMPAIAVSGPFGAVKEQSSGLYAQHLAERGFITVAFDPSFTGESGGEPRRMASPTSTPKIFLPPWIFFQPAKPLTLSALALSEFAVLEEWLSTLPPSTHASKPPLPPQCTI